MKNLKHFYRDLEITSITTYNQHDNDTVEIDIDILLKNGDSRTLEIKNQLYENKFDKGYFARSIGLPTSFDNGNEFIEDILSCYYIFDDKDAQEFLINEEYIIEKEIKGDLKFFLEILQELTSGFSQDSVQRKNIISSMEKAYELGFYDCLKMFNKK